MSEHLIKLTARFLEADTGVPLTGPSLRIRFIDRDAFSDDVLGESPLAPDGRAETVTSTAAFRSGLAGAIAGVLGEAKPDLYCEVRDAGKPVFRTKVEWNAEPEKTSSVTGETARSIDLGTFQVRRGRGVDSAREGNAGSRHAAADTGIGSSAQDIGDSGQGIGDASSEPGYKPLKPEF